MRIAIITLGVYPNQTGGVQIHSYYHALGLKKAQDEVVVLTKKNRGGTRLSNIGRVQVESLGSGIPIIGQIAFLFDALAVLMAKRKSIDLVHVHFATYFMLPAYLFRLITSTPFVVSCHGLDVVYLRKSRVWRTFQMVLFRDASMVTSTSSQVKELLESDYQVPIEKIRLVPNGVDEREISLAISHQRRESGRRNVAFVANLRPVKDPLSVLQAAAIASTRILNLSLIVVGGGPMFHVVEEFARENHLEDLVILKGEQSHSDTLATIANCEALVLASLNEGGNPIVLMEAMALGKPVVATNVGGVRDVVVDGVNGFIVPIRSPDSLAQRLVEILENPELAAKLGATARETAGSYSWNRTVNAYIAIYDSVLSGQRFWGSRNHEVFSMISRGSA